MSENGDWLGDDAIGSLHWRACECCEHGLEEGGCDLNVTDNDIKLDYILEIVCCTKYEPQEKVES